MTIRSIRTDDAAAIQAAFAHLSREARYSRFMAPLNKLPPAMLKRAVQPAADRELALVAVAGDGADEIVVGGARYVRGSDDHTCEFAVTVSDDWRAAGLGSRMLKELIRDARARGLTRMEGYVLAANSPMLNLARRLGFGVAASAEGPSVRLVTLDLERAGGAVT
ncbi:MAG TPA: GNAT family N-acetyltransferase [Burkholderiales bacterium]|nr:GNAT family N-acetyltransferase [Burkholderiales bacterium]